MKILVLGASSFSGGWFCDVAKSAGHEVERLSRPEFDLRDRACAASVFDRMEAGYSYVVNYAAINVVPESWQRAAIYYETNLVGISRLADFLARGRIGKFVQVSTPEVYGSTGEFLKEGAAFNPSTPYAVSRAAGDQHLALLHREFGFPVCFTRTVNVYGEGQQAYRIIPKTAAACLSGKKLPLEGGGRSMRSFIHAEDAARATLRVLEDGRPGETYHVAHPDQTRIIDLVTSVCLRLGRSPEEVIEEAPERVGKDMAYQLDDSKIRHELGWREAISLSEGLYRTLAALKARYAVAA